MMGGAKESSSGKPFRPVGTSSSSTSKASAEYWKKQRKNKPSPGVLITGASSGIGLAFAEYYARIYSHYDYGIILVSRWSEKFTSAHRLLKQKYPHARLEVCPMDLTEPQSALKIWDFCKKKNIRISSLINNAGFGHMGAFVEMRPKMIRDMLAVNVHTVRELSLYFLREMRRDQDQGILINIASVVGFQGIGNMALYAATKAFVINFTEGLVSECRPRNVRVLAICPGTTQTDFFRVAIPGEHFHGWSESARQRSVRRPEDVVETTMRALSAEQSGAVVDGILNRALMVLLKFPSRLQRTRLASAFSKSRSGGVDADADSSHKLIKLFRHYQKKWDVGPVDLFWIVIVFALTGITAVYLRRLFVPIMWGDYRGWEYYVSAPFILMPLYYMLLMIYGGIAGYGRIFFPMAKRPLVGIRNLFRFCRRLILRG